MDEQISVTTVNNSFFVVTLVFALLLMVALGITIFFAVEKTTLNDPPPPLQKTPQELTLQTNYGAAAYSHTPINERYIVSADGSDLLTMDMCQKSKHGSWMKDHCVCQDPYFGPTCQRQKHDQRYFAVGGTTSSTKYEPITVLNNVPKSFSDNSCSKQCDAKSECIGFIYENNRKCTLLTDQVIADQITYSPSTEPNLYLRTSESLTFPNKVFIAAQPNSFPPRFWLVDSTNSFQSITIDSNPVVINFYPTYIKTDKRSTGIYCRHPFTKDEVSVLLNRGNSDNTYIHAAGTDLAIPEHWQFNKIFVMYVK